MIIEKVELKIRNLTSPFALKIDNALMDSFISLWTQNRKDL
ncbi:hypothetical protein SAMN05661096_03339 [Marivirga sericea]|uniref:Uncharacterized protein n=1 Tax=Marivirga sericea TaxID=1028 RepID=A0A1X7L1K2_9BACT|nr:hypothetical protein SAMN05661096_03339 [Marivirga sericea]